MTITRKLLDEYREMVKKKEIPLLEAELRNMLTSDAGLGSSTIFDYRTGQGRPQSVVGFDWDKYEHRQVMLERKKARAKAAEDWIESIEDGQTRCVFRMFYKDGMAWEKIADKTGYSKSPDYPRKMIRDRYLDKMEIL